MKYLDRKGMSRDVLLGLILAALVIIILSVALFPGAFNFFETFKQDEVCKERIGLASFSKSGTGKPLSPLPLECPRNVLVIKYKDVVEEVNGKKIINQDKASSLIADRMSRCWNKVGEGKVDPFSNYDYEDESLCLVCDKINFDEDLTKFVETNLKTASPEEYHYYAITSPVKFMQTHKLSDKKDSLTYWNYLKYGPKTMTTDQEKLLGSSVILPGSTILLSLHKFDEKDFDYYLSNPVTLICGTVLVVGGLIVAWPVIAAVAAAGTFTAAVGALATTATATGLVGLGGGLLLKGGAIAMIAGSTHTTFSNCEECNGYGGIMLLPPEAELEAKITVNLPEGKTEEIIICDQLVN